MIKLNDLPLPLAALLIGCAMPGAGARTAGPAANPIVRLTFVPEADAFLAATQEYERIWAEEGQRIVAAMESISGLSFVQPAYADTAITAIVLERASSSGYRERPMEMRASYPAATKRATLIHELGHRLMSNLWRREEEQHETLFLWLYDVWVELYGQGFADDQVLVEKARRGPYSEAWDRAMAMSRADRAAAWQARLAERMPVAETRAFTLYSDPLLNLHDFLFWSAQAERPIDSRVECIASLRAADREAFDAARGHYARAFAPGRSFGQLLIALRYELAGFADLGIVPDSAMASSLAHLRAAAAAYQTCWWQGHDARNRAWIGDLVLRLNEHEDAIRARLSRLYRSSWGGRIPVDVVGYVGSAGANSVVDPDHILMSSVNPGYQGDAALEMVFHEASHTLMGPGRGAVWQALENAGSKPGLERLPHSLWHPIIFYTAGRVIQERLAEHGTAAYDPYMYRNGLFERGWLMYREPLERYWQAYLDDRVDLDDAALRLLQALKDAAR